MYRDKWQSKLIDQLSFKYGMDKRVVQEVVHYPLLFTKRVMNDGADDRPIRIRSLGVFAYRGSRDKQKVEKPKYDVIIQNLEELYIKYYNKEFDSLELFSEYVTDKFKEKDYSAIRKVHEIFKDVIKYKREPQQKD